MNFRTKDLMVTVLPKGAVDLNPNVLCRFPTHGPICWQRCSFLPTYCHCTFISPLDCGPTLIPTITPVCGGSMTPELQGQVRIEDIAALREQLKAQLTQLDQVEASLKEAPSTLAEAETLEGHLKDALAQVQAQKANLKATKK